MNLEKTIALTLSSHLRESNEMSSNIESTSEKEKVTYDFGNCKVCNDKASGIHYGVASCEGCKVRELKILNGNIISNISNY